MPPVLGIEGKHAHLASPDELARGIQAAKEVFARSNADVAAAAAAIRKIDNDELLTREEALLCVVWDDAEDAALRAITVGWLSRDVDLQLAVTSDDAG